MKNKIKRQNKKDAKHLIYAFVIAIFAVIGLFEVISFIVNLF